MTDFLVALLILALFLGLLVAVLYDIDHAIEEASPEPVCQCRKGGRCETCIERDGLTKAAA